MFNSFPFDEWSETITDFWTWGGHNSTGTYIQLAVGFVLMVGSLIAWVRMEDRKLERQAAQLRASGALDAPPDPGPVGSV
jgi:hypothetical protein